MSKSRRTWCGLEEKKAQLQKAALRYFEADQALGKVCETNGISAIGATILARKNPGTSSLREAEKAASALRTLEELHRELVIDHNMDFDVVRREWATILNPSPQEAKLCDDLVKKGDAKAAQKDSENH